MAATTLSILKPSVNNLTVRIFVRAAKLDFEEVDVWGQTTTPDFLQKDPAHLTPMIEEEGLPRGSMWESCAIMAYLCNKHGLEQFYPADPGRRAMIDNAMFYVIGTLYPLITRATYPALSFPQYPGEVGSSRQGDDLKAAAQREARRDCGAVGRLPRVLPRWQPVHRRRLALDRGHAPRCVARVPERDRLRLPELGVGVHVGDGDRLSAMPTPRPPATCAGYIASVRRLAA
jgi:glutathione S-transferase